MNKIIITDIPKPNGEIKGCWYNGYPIHQGHSESSLNYATLFAKEHDIIPDQERISREYEFFKTTLRASGFDLTVLPFPDELNQIDNLHHDAIFLRDSGFMYKNYWVKARYSAEIRQAEAEVYAKIIAEKYGKEIIELPEKAYLEFGEVTYIETINGSYYFGGISRSNKIGHDFIKNMVKPDNCCIIQTEGYHLDTVFTPVINKDNKLVAFIIAHELLAADTLNELKKFNVELIYINRKDSSGQFDDLGLYAVNSLVAPGILLNSSLFTTKGVEERLIELGIKHHVVPLSDFRYAGGSVHCLTNEIYE